MGDLGQCHRAGTGIRWTGQGDATWWGGGGRDGGRDGVSLNKGGMGQGPCPPTTPVLSIL